MAKSAPLEITTSIQHNLPDNWRIKVYGVNGMKEVNSTDNYLMATIESPTKLLVNSLNSLNWSAYTSGGVVEYNKPIDLTPFSASMRIFDQADTYNTYYTASSASGGIVLDNTLKTITITIPSLSTEAFSFDYASYELILTDSSNDSVTTILSGSFRVL